jgi:hypothetical protein
MRTKMLAALISMVGCLAFLACDRGPGYQNDDRAGEASTQDQSATDPQYETQDATQTEEESMEAIESQSETQASAAGQAAGQQTAAAELGPYEQWDVDSSGDVSKTEFDSKFASTPAWSGWDRNGDQNLDATEAAHVQWSMWDRNADGQLPKDEWDGGIEQMDVDADYAEADANQDGKLTEAEFTQWFQGGKAWSEWDQNGNGKVALDEAATALWNMWDGNDDNKIEQGEWWEDASKA